MNPTPPSDPYGELFSEAFAAFQGSAFRGNAEGSIFSSRKGFEAAHPIYVAALEARDAEIARLKRELAVYETALQERLKQVKGLLQEAEAKDRKIERMNGVVIGMRHNFTQDFVTLGDYESARKYAHEAEQRGAEARKHAQSLYNILFQVEFRSLMTDVERTYFVAAKNFLESTDGN